MSSAEYGLLAPGRADSAVEAATDDAAYVRALLDAEAALTRAQAAVGLAPPSAAEAVTAAAGDTDRYEPRDLAVRARSGGNPVIPLVAALTTAVAGRDAGAAAYVHRGATSQDILDTATMLVCSRALEAVLGDLDATAAALGRLAAEHRDTPMAGRTLTQHAVPVTFGLKAAGWRTLVLDARDRLTAVRGALPAQLGGAAGTLAAFHAFAEADGPGPDSGAGTDLGLRLLTAYAAETGLAEPALPWHTLRTPVADLAGALAHTAGALGKIAADVLALSRTETAELAEGSGGGSSAMPHKSNPVRATLIAAAARQVPALAGVLYGSLAAEDERPAGAWHAEWQPLRDALRLVGGAARDAAELSAGLRVRPERMRANLAATGGGIVAERLAAVLGAPLGRDTAKRLLTDVARRAAEDGTGLAEELDRALRARHPAVADAFPAARLRELADPAAYTGSAGALVDRALRRPGPHRAAPTAQETA
ncbi:3-carboxy-cis,cis-muconate cycloisomerase [Streptomyces chrestomyceticus JCM 4735]|uniref:3-carboxy-cis,cis-muconate cycloisomerase n=1 Tax=Streptomyces chrestomyceticus JCM 4735 TaxID=1306181 RepID=A0A7U9PZ70_9ACTN|nr:3-carboxy-cis,cis-muconate cycloisomerase [Streptomyces chrestomyceticus]GCD33969.1 3-carboxy-cis,cis-muconate cycloisomerase [Streptomyces chrestomyceticus JCM 4735]